MLLTELITVLHGHSVPVYPAATANRWQGENLEDTKCTPFWRLLGEGAAKNLGGISMLGPRATVPLPALSNHRH